MAHPHRLPLVAAALVAACLLPIAGGETFAARWAFMPGADGAHVLHAFTAQWVHWSIGHTLFNAAVLGVCAAWLEQRLARWHLVAIVALACGIVAGLLFALPDLTSYRGASGLAACLATLCVIALSARQRHSEVIGIGIATSLALSAPAWFGHGAGVLPTGVRPVWEIHFALALAATAFALLPHSPLPGTGEGKFTPDPS